MHNVFHGLLGPTKIFRVTSEYYTSWVNPSFGYIILTGHPNLPVIPTHTQDALATHTILEGETSRIPRFVIFWIELNLHVMTSCTWCLVLNSLALMVRLTGCILACNVHGAVGVNAVGMTAYAVPMSGKPIYRGIWGVTVGELLTLLTCWFGCSVDICTSDNLGLNFKKSLSLL